MLLLRKNIVGVNHVENLTWPNLEQVTVSDLKKLLGFFFKKYK